MGKQRRDAHSTKLAIYHKALLPGSNATSLAHAEGLDESIVHHWVKNKKELEGSVAESNIGGLKARHIN